MAAVEGVLRPTLRSGRLDPRNFREVVWHLAKREVTSMHRWTLLGWAWPVTRQLFQLAVLVFVFSNVLDLGIENFPVFVFSGLIAWTWFSTGIGGATSVLLSQRHLVFQPRFPTLVLPIVSITVPLVDVLMALPVLAVMLLVTGEIHATMLFLPVLVVLQIVLMAGIAWLTAAATVYLRDVQNIVLVGLTMLFYLTPVFYDTSRVPGEYTWVLNLNPIGTLIEAWRDVLLDGRLPPAGELAYVAGVGVVLAGLGAVFFRRVSSGFVDEL